VHDLLRSFERVAIFTVRHRDDIEVTTCAPRAELLTEDLR